VQGQSVDFSGLVIISSRTDYSVLILKAKLFNIEVIIELPRK
jgi:hypothetical protein